MKKTILTIAITMFVVGTMLTACQSSAKKVENAEDKLQDSKDNVVKAQQNLNEARQDSITEYLEFKKISRERIRAHEKSIADFKTRIANDEKEVKANYEKKLAELEKRNTDMIKRLDDYNAEGKENWNLFKKQFNNDLEELGESLKNLNNKNAK